MKNWKLVFASLLALLIMVVTPLSITAAGNGTISDQANRPEIKGALSIVAPRMATPGSEMSLAVFLRKDQTPVEGVQIWAVDGDKNPAFKEAVKILKKKRIHDLAGEDIPSILKNSARKLGETDERGKLAVTFVKEGKYTLLAIKPGYLPDFSVVVVRTFLVLAGPEGANVGEMVTFNLTEKVTGDAVAGAEVFAVTGENMPALRKALQKERFTHRSDPENADWAGVLNAHAELLGLTGENGQIDCTFDQEGKYALVATLDAELSGFVRLLIESP